MDNNDGGSNALAIEKRRALAEAIRSGKPVVVTASGQVEERNDAEEQGLSGIEVPDGKLA